MPFASVIAQADFAGHWEPLYHEDQPERIPGPEIGDYAGIPINAAARLRADSYVADRISAVTQYQCRPHGSDYSMRGLAFMRIQNVLDPNTEATVAINVRMNFQEMERTIWLDGRQRPGPLEPHTWQGFSTGEWDRNQLNVYTTHLKKSYLRRNGIPRSEYATYTDHWVRHGDYLTITTTIEDAAFLTEPLVRSQTWRLDRGMQMGTDICHYVREIPGPINQVPHHLPGENPFLDEIAEQYGLPYDGIRGGAETMYPEFRDDMELPPDPPLVCTKYCRCMENNIPCI